MSNAIVRELADDGYPLGPLTEPAPFTRYGNGKYHRLSGCTRTPGKAGRTVHVDLVTTDPSRFCRTCLAYPEDLVHGHTRTYLRGLWSARCAIAKARLVLDRHTTAQPLPLNKAAELWQALDLLHEVSEEVPEVTQFLLERSADLRAVADQARAHQCAARDNRRRGWILDLIGTVNFRGLLPPEYADDQVRAIRTFGQMAANDTSLLETFWRAWEQTVRSGGTLTYAKDTAFQRVRKHHRRSERPDVRADLEGLCATWAGRYQEVDEAARAHGPVIAAVNLRSVMTLATRTWLAHLEGLTQVPGWWWGLLHADPVLISWLRERALDVYAEKAAAVVVLDRALPGDGPEVLTTAAHLVDGIDGASPQARLGAALTAARGIHA